jgi:hypothetical protein
LRAVKCDVVNFLTVSQLKKIIQIVANMSAIGSLVFCTDCGNLLESSTGNENTVLTCECCGAQNRGMVVNSGKKCNID